MTIVPQPLDIPPLASPNNPGSIPTSSESVLVEWDRGGIELIDRLADEWRDLCFRSSDDQPFFHPEWIRAFLRAFAPNTLLLLVTARVAGRLVALLPLIEQQQVMLGLPVRVLASPTNVHSCRFDIVVQRGMEGQAALRALWDSFKQHHEWNVLALASVSEDGVLPQLVAMARDQGYRTAKIESFASPYFSLADFTGDWDLWLSRLKGDFRRELRRRARKLEAQGEVRLQHVDHADPEALQRFFELEASGWKGGEGTAIMRDPAARCFYDEVATAASRRGYFSLYILEVSGRPIAGHFGLTYGKRYFVPKLAFDEQFSALAPGHLMINAVARDCAERGVVEFDFLGEQMEWKTCWTPLARKLYSTYVFSDDYLGRILHTVKFGFKSGVKRLLGRFE